MNTPPVLVISCSLHPQSRSRRLAEAAAASLRSLGAPVELIDLRDYELPFCDGGASYSAPSVPVLEEQIAKASAILLAAPVYNYDLNAAAKNLVELTGDAWEGKPVGFLCAAGGRSSYMSPIGLANNLMLDFRCWIIPRFVYATKADFAGDQVSDVIGSRVEQLAATALAIGGALQQAKNQTASQA
jgi:NAD(P)H-dependent FMN reductase